MHKERERKTTWNEKEEWDVYDDRQAYGQVEKDEAGKLKCLWIVLKPAQGWRKSNATSCDIKLVRTKNLMLSFLASVLYPYNNREDGDDDSNLFIQLI